MNNNNKKNRHLHQKLALIYIALLLSYMSPFSFIEAYAEPDLKQEVEELKSQLDRYKKASKLRFKLILNHTHRLCGTTNEPLCREAALFGKDVFIQRSRALFEKRFGLLSDPEIDRLWSRYKGSGTMTMCSHKAHLSQDKTTLQLEFHDQKIPINRSSPLTLADSKAHQSLIGHLEDGALVCIQFSKKVKRTSDSSSEDQLKIQYIVEDLYLAEDIRETFSRDEDRVYTFTQAECEALFPNCQEGASNERCKVALKPKSPQQNTSAQDSKILSLFKTRLRTYLKTHAKTFSSQI